MVTCYKCKFGQKCSFYDEIADEIFDMVYCSATGETLSENQAKDDLPCDLYVEKLDDNETA